MDISFSVDDFSTFGLPSRLLLHKAREYRKVRRGMRCEVVVLSRSKGFSKLTGFTEAYLPELDLFVGRHSLLDKR